MHQKTYICHLPRGVVVQAQVMRRPHPQQKELHKLIVRKVPVPLRGALVGRGDRVHVLQLVHQRTRQPELLLYLPHGRGEGLLPGFDVAADADVPPVGKGVFELGAALQEHPALVIHQPNVAGACFVWVGWVGGLGG